MKCAAQMICLNASQMERSDCVGLLINDIADIPSVPGHSKGLIIYGLGAD